MKKRMNKKNSTNGEIYKLIFNPAAGAKRNLGASRDGLKIVTDLLDKYQISYKTFITRKAGDGKEFARNAEKEGFKRILVMGGDGTIGEVVNGVIGTNVIVGILPGGTFMNVAKMLSIPNDLEKAVELIKIGRVRKMDVGVMSSYGIADKHYFLESVGIGVEADFHKYFKKLEHGKISALGDIFRLVFHYHRFFASIKSDSRNDINLKTHLIRISNGPLSGASLNTAPKAKLDDKLLTISIYRMSKFQIINYLVGSFYKRIIFHPHILSFQTKKAYVETIPTSQIHADGRFFVDSPMEFSVLGKALNVITGFEDEKVLEAFKKS